MKKRECDNIEKAVSPAEAEPQAMPTGNGVSPSIGNTPVSLSIGKKPENIGGRYFTRVEKKYTFQPTVSDHITSGGGSE
jgi:hypothetical protein